MSAGIFAIRGKLDGEKSQDFVLKEQFIGIVIGDKEFLLPISVVCEIVMVKPITLVPGCPKMIEGVFNIRGIIMPAINLRRMMGMSPGSGGATSRIIVVKNNSLGDGNAELVGLLVDGISFVASLFPTQIENPAIATKIAGADLIMSIAKLDNRVIGIVDVNKVIGVAAGRDSNQEAA